MDYGTRRIPKTQGIDWEISEGINDYLNEQNQIDPVLLNSLHQAATHLKVHLKRRDSRELRTQEEPAEFFRKHQTTEYRKYLRY